MASPPTGKDALCLRSKNLKRVANRSHEVIHAMKEWRHQHPRATFHEIETALDVRLANLRVQMLHYTVLTSPSVDLPTLREIVFPKTVMVKTRSVVILTIG